MDPLRGLAGEKGGMGGLSPVSGLLREGPVVVRRYLNDWVRFVRPGVYTLRVKSRRVAGKELESNALRLEIVEAPEEWEREQIERARRALRKIEKSGGECCVRWIAWRRTKNCCGE